MSSKYKTIEDGQKLVQDSAQYFETHKIYHIKAGKKINNYDFIQENNVDTDIYQTLEKYGTLQPIQVDEQALAQEFEKMDLRDLYNYKEKANTMWLNLPLEIRKEFHNDITEFMQNGKEWLNNRIAKEQAKQEILAEQQKEQKDEQK